MLEMKNPKGKFLSCITEVSLYITYISYDQWPENLWFLYDALNIHGWTWGHHFFLENMNDVCVSATLHTESHILERVDIIEPHIEEFHAW